MPIPHYGAWIVRGIRYESEREADDPVSPHIHLYFKDHPEGRQERRAAVNVKSRDKDSRLVYWISKNFTHPLTHHLSELDYGFKLIKPNKGPLQGPDYLRTDDLLPGGIEAGSLVPHDVPGPDNDILDKVEPILAAAIKDSARIYLFGSSFGSGIHDIHMNQGSLPQYPNGVYQDGAILVEFQNGHWEAIFLAFASQKTQTDDDSGKPLSGSDSFAEILGAR